MHEGFIVEIKELRKHSNADRLQCATIFGNNVIVGLDVKIGDIGVFFPTELQLGIEYCEKNNLLRKKDEDGNNIGGYLDPNKRNVKALKLRGERSEGLYSPISSLSDFTNIEELYVGDKITILDGILICQKYIPRGFHKEKNGNGSKVKKVDLRQKYPLFEEHIDTEQLMYNLDTFKVGDYCTITLKMHGTSGRTTLTLKESGGLLGKIRKFFNIQKYEVVSGTRRVILESYDGGYYGSNSFRKQYHDLLSSKLYKGMTIYYEIVGYTEDGNPIMGSCPNTKLDKDFIKMYGDTTEFSYDCEVGKSEMYVYRISLTTLDGYIVELPYNVIKEYCEQMNLKIVPLLDSFIFTTQEDLLERVKKHEDGIDPIGKTHIREGICLRIENTSRFKVFKHKNFNFKVLSGIIQEKLEESSDIDSQEINEDILSEM